MELQVLTQGKQQPAFSPWRLTLSWGGSRQWVWPSCSSASLCNLDSVRQREVESHLRASGCFQPQTAQVWCGGVLKPTAECAGCEVSRSVGWGVTMGMLRWWKLPFALLGPASQEQFCLLTLMLQANLKGCWESNGEVQCQQHLQQFVSRSLIGTTLSHLSDRLFSQSCSLAEAGPAFSL